MKVDYCRAPLHRSGAKVSIKAVKYEHGYTKTGEAMEKALAHYSAKMRKEKETAKVRIRKRLPLAHGTTSPYIILTLVAPANEANVAVEAIEAFGAIEVI